LNCHFILPLKSTMAATEIDPTAMPMPRRKGMEPAAILLVDDNQNNLLALESILESADHRLVKAQTADEALLALIKDEYAAIILDVQMPGVNGIELARLIKQRKKTQNIPIIFLTGHYLDSEHAVLGYGAGAVDYLTKPVHPEILRSKVGVFVDLFRKTRALGAANAELESKNIALEHQAEERLRRIRAENAQVEAETASAAKDKFLAMLSHELRTPLTPVLHAVTLLREETDLPSRVREGVEMIERNIQLEARLIDDLLDLARVRTGKLQLDMHPADVHSLIGHAVDIWAPEFRRKRIQVQTKLQARHATMKGDPPRLLQVFLNLLTNAVKFTPEDGIIAITTADEPAAGTLKIEFADTGIGIEAAQLSRIFDAFEQVPLPGSPGLGLGLAICKALVEAHGGSIVARSEGSSKGSVFQVRLPVSKAAPVLPEQEPQSPVSTEPVLMKLLVVEDHRDTAFALRQLLQRRGYEVQCAHSVAEALDVAKAFSFDILITDIGLPDGTGTELFEQLKQREKSDRPLRGVALSGFGMEDDISRSNRVGFSAHLTKPVSFARLHRCLREIELEQP
jgi:signal transduction histidine kinase